MSPSPELHPDVDHVLFTTEQLSAVVSEMGRNLAAEYADKRPVVMVVMNGAFMFASDLVRAMHPVPKGLELLFVRASSYGTGTESSGEVKLVTTVKPEEVQGRHVIVVEDIVDTGRTLHALLDGLKKMGVASAVTAVLLDKKERRTVELQPDYCCFKCPDEFVVGYGLDFAELYRSLPYVGVLKPEVYTTATAE